MAGDKESANALDHQMSDEVIIARGTSRLLIIPHGPLVAGAGPVEGQPQTGEAKAASHG